MSGEWRDFDEHTRECPDCEEFSCGTRPPRWPRAPGPYPSRPIPHETIRRVNEYVEQRQRLLNRKQRAAHVQALEVDRIHRRIAIFIWRSKTPQKSAHDLLRLTSQCSSIRGSTWISRLGHLKSRAFQALSDPSADSHARGSTN